MPEARGGAIHIGQLNLRMPGNSAEAASRVADGIRDRLGRNALPRASRQLGALSVRVSVPAGAGEAEISDAVADAIVRAVRK